jgi:CRP/FNR family cyclic AMP-dependent transcriptional regulator
VSCPVEGLRDLPVFAALGEATLEAVAAATTVRHYRRNMFVFAEGEPAESFHFVLSGRVRVFRDSAGGHEQTLQILERGGLLSVVSFLDGRPYPASAQTLVDSEIGSIRNAELARLAQEHGALAWGLLQQIATRLLWAQGRIYDLALRSATGRVVSVLLQFAREQGVRDAQGRFVVDLPLTHRELGQITGVSRETVTRTLGQLRSTGALRWTEDGLLVVDPGGLGEWLDL